MLYAEHASQEFNDRLHNALLRIAADVRAALGNNLIALILGGGYGRGEGGVLITPEGEKPYNDLDFVLVIEKKQPDILEKLHSVSKKFEEELKIDVDFSRPLTIEDVRNFPHYLMWHDLLNGHAVIEGPGNILTANAPKAILQPVPCIEATRLLLNRGAGLLWSMRILHGCETAPDSDFLRRNTFKCIQAMGDALLIAFQTYTTQYRGRSDLLASLAESDSTIAELGLLNDYRRAESFKLNPSQESEVAPTLNSLQTLAERWGKVFLLIEEKRTGKNWDSCAAYVSWKKNREPDQNRPSKWPRNLIRNLQMRRFSLRYPREHLYKQLPGLLGLTTETYSNWDSASKDFMHIWNRFN